MRELETASDLEQVGPLLDNTAVRIRLFMRHSQAFLNVSLLTYTTKPSRRSMQTKLIY